MENCHIDDDDDRTQYDVKLHEAGRGVAEDDAANNDDVLLHEKIRKIEAMTEQPAAEGDDDVLLPPAEFEEVFMAHQKSAKEEENKEEEEVVEVKDEEEPKQRDRKRRRKGAGCVLQIAIKIKDTDSFSSSNIEVLLVNGCWDCNGRVPRISAEMHNVSNEDLHIFTNALVVGNQSPSPPAVIAPSPSPAKQMKLSSSATTAYTEKKPPLPMNDDNGIEGDKAAVNLSWLFNYKINKLPPVPEQLPQSKLPPLAAPATVSQCSSSSSAQEKPVAIQQVLIINPYIEYHTIDKLGNLVDLPSEMITTTNIPEVEVQDGKYSYIQPPNQQPHYQHRLPKYMGPKKPPFIYTDLIEYALVENGELTVSGIYQWIADHFPYYNQNDDRWKNSVRHNLSINPRFRKGSKAVHGAGHLWTIAQKDDQKSWQIKRQRMQQFIQSTMGEYSMEKLQEIELATATASIIPSTIDLTEFNVTMKTRTTNAAANGAVGVLQQQPQIPGPGNLSTECVIDMQGGLGDFLCPPVSKEQVVEESGLTSSDDYLITDLNPNALGLNVGETVDLINTTHLYDDLGFHGYELHTE